MYMRVMRGFEHDLFVSTMKRIPAATVQQFHKPHPCDRCYQSRFCLPTALPREQLGRMREIVHSTMQVEKGECLFSSGSAMDKVYAVHVGSFKSVVHSPDGRHQVLGFHVPGELMGLENLVAQRYAIDVVALEESEACEVNVRDLELAARDVSTLQHQLHCLIGDRLARAQQDQFNLGSAHAEERLARFLLDLSQRLKARGLSPRQFTLHMSRDEMASYLGLKMETVSRLLSRFHRDGLIKLSVRELQITDREGLAALIAPLEP